MFHIAKKTFLQSEFMADIKQCCPADSLILCRPIFFLPVLFLPRWLYWTDWGDTAYIGRAGMDGSNVSAIITTKLEWPNALTIDYTNNKIFFADSHLNFLE